MYIWHKETTPGTTGARCTIRDGSGLFVAECIASDAAAIVEAPAMLAALRATVALCELHIAERSADPEEEGNFLSCAYLVNARAILARIDGTPTDEADDFGAGAAVNLSRGALIEAAGEALAMAGPTGGDAQDFTTPAGIITAAQGYVSDPGQWNPPTPAQVAYLLALSGISHGPIADDPAD